MARALVTLYVENRNLVDPRKEIVKALDDQIRSVEHAIKEAEEKVTDLKARRAELRAIFFYWSGAPK